jgi:lipopolysaccharide/colanic/teichoic acid biosynthesis glycosyltransferase
MAHNLLKRIFGNGSGSVSDPLLPADQFRTLILHECARCDRNAHAFSLIRIDLRDGSKGMEQSNQRLRALSRSVVERMRTTDEIGWLDGHSVGVFLPETGLDGAKSLARDACQDFSYQIYTYPSHIDISNDLNNGGPRHKRQDERDRKPVTVSDMEEEERLPLERSSEESTESTSIAREDTSSSGNPGSVNSVIELLMPPGAPAWKRVYDIFGSTFLLIVLSPVFAAVALYIKIVSRGPVFFRQKRVGYLGRPFTILKFRTMRADADNDIHRSHLKELIKGDKVLTKLDQETDCRWLPLAGLMRKTCLDELPQLFNVLKGEMSLVGPRPVLYYEAEEFSLWQHQRFHAVPGMTGLWQVSGKNRLTFSQMMRLDARYSRKYNFFMDHLIFIRTIPAIIGQVSDSLRGKFSAHPHKKSVSVWKRSLSNFVRQVFL